jgi:radical SAM protein with 4Fe4S-binding SPASM domain
MSDDNSTRASGTGASGTARGWSRKLHAITLETTLRCDQACVFCGSKAGKKRAALELSTDEIRSLFRQAAEMGVKEVELTGGETYLREDWVTLIEMATEHGLTCALVTAGRGIDDAKARLAHEAGLDRVGVSLDGLKATHEALRGTPNGFDLALRAMAAFRAAGVAVGCNTQVNARNWRELPDLAELLLTQGLYAWQIQLMIPMGRAAEATDLWLQPYDLLEVIPQIAAIIERCARERLMVYAGDNVGYFGPHEAVLRRYSTKHGHTHGCAAGMVGGGVDAAGNVTGCLALDAAEHIAGNIREQGLARIFDEAKVLRRNEDAKDVWGFCATCYYAAVCRGGCSATAIALTGRPGNNPYCHHRALELAGQGRRERLGLGSPRHDGARGYVEFEIVTEEVGAAATTPE